MFRRPVASYARHRGLSDASGSGLQRVGQTRDVRFFLGLEPHGEVGRDGVGTCAPAPGPVWGRGGAMELTVSLASGVQPGVGRCPLGADATCWNRRRKRPGWLAPSQAPSTPHFAPSVQGSVLASWLSQRGLQWAREPGTCRVFLFCSLRNDSSSNRAALLFRSSALTCKYLNFFAFRYRETCLVFLFFLFSSFFPTAVYHAVVYRGLSWVCILFYLLVCLLSLALSVVYPCALRDPNISQQRLAGDGGGRGSILL